MRAILLSAAMLAMAACAGAPANTAPESPTPLVVQMPKRISGDVDLASLETHELFRLERGGEVRLHVRVCVEPSGKVTRASIERPSGHDAYDAAVLASVRSWTYQPYPDGDESAVCGVVKVVYRS